MYKAEKIMRIYSLRKKPASARHLTVAVFGKISWKSSQCIRVANPPAEQPERRACGVINALVGSKNLQLILKVGRRISSI